MDLRHYRSFLALAEELHFGKAAERLHMAQPPLSQQIRQMESHLGVRLFERSTRSVRLTSAGEAMLAPARRVLEESEEAERAAKAGGRGEYGRVTIGFAGASSRFSLPLLARAVREEYPNLDLVLKGQMYANTALSELLNRSVDIGFVRLPFDLPGVEHLVIEREELICALPANHPLAKGAEVSLRDLSEESFVTFPPDAGSTLRTITQKACMEVGYSPRITQAAPDSYTIHALVAAGVGVTLTFSSCLHIRQPGVVYLPVTEDLPVSHSAIAWLQDNSSPALQSFLRVVREILPLDENSGKISALKFSTPTD